MRKTVDECPSPLMRLSQDEMDFGFILGVKTCDVVLCCATIAVLLSIVLFSLLSLFYVNGEVHRFLRRG